MTLLRVDNLSTWFHTREGVTKAVDGISFELDRGRTLGIVGESGSGKSVACHSLLGLVPSPPGRIESGTADFDGRDLLKSSEKALRRIRGHRIGMIFQDPMTSLNPFLRIGDQLIEPLRVHKRMDRNAARRRAIEALHEVGIGDPERRIREYPHQFSGGMRQRVMIAMALITEPELLIADEPTTALDVTIQAQILDLIKRLQQTHRLAVIFITHDLGVVANIADHILVMHQGKVVESGNVEHIFHHSQHPYTRKLLESIPTTAKPVPAKIDPGAGAFLELNDVRTVFRSDKGVFFKRPDTQVNAVDGVSLNIRRGETLGLVGESGSGKSTLGRSIMRLVDIDEGTIVFDRQRLDALQGKALKQSRPKFQMIFQDPYASLNPRMTVFDTLAEPLRVHGLADTHTVLSRVHRLMDEVELPHRAIRKYPHEFSGGQRQRIAIARALALQPRLVIADEPVSALDVTIQAQILELLLNLTQAHDLTMLFISHDLSVVRYISDRVAVMYRGKIVETGDTETVFRDPQHDYTRRLLAAVPAVDQGLREQRTD